LPARKKYEIAQMTIFYFYWFNPWFNLPGSPNDR